MIFFLSFFFPPNSYEVFWSSSSSFFFLTAWGLGDWLILEDQVKCLTSFAAEHASYVAKPVELSWTEEQAMMLQADWLTGQNWAKIRNKKSQADFASCQLSIFLVVNVDAKKRIIE